ncbi:MAG: efflux RND transporter periplasmic adaptor subunit, partial [Gammaproteobacteria bacterium]|nr:efflux RND transporter periplasmic adaptor subunit [Gammaproteobacteria bacterium]
GRQAGAVATGLPARVAVPPTQVAVLAAPVTGVIHRVDKTHSDSVQAGEPIATLTSAQLVEDQLSLFRAASQHRLAAENAARDAHLLKEGIIAEARYRTARAEEQRALAEVRVLRVRLRLSGLGAEQIRRAEEDAGVTETVQVCSPLAGTIIELEAVPGTRFEIGAPLAKVADLSRLWLEVQVPVAQAGLVQVGQPVKIAGARASGAVGRGRDLGRGDRQGASRGRRPGRTAPTRSGGRGMGRCCRRCATVAGAGGGRRLAGG